MNSSSVAVPGQRLAPHAQHRAGHGTYVRDGAIYASILGHYSIVQSEVRVERPGKTVGSAQVLRLQDEVICKVTKVTSRQVLVDIISVNGIALQESFPGTIRLEDVRNHDIDKLMMEDVFSPGMLVKALVLSFGDTRSYFLSTAKAGLGIVRASQQQENGSIDMETN
uniref:S1 motif domain-containing protein n=1 Tax=Globisporangium ultimum (strain ATCC 200006 / CBS 805.95 / DAOM BR144) TaxID=431595 RepID=K3WSW7_GLOUD